ncbi:PEP-CTERM sorting domain-containing protein [Altererythrobacter xixiisoli]|uniref:PEP-CTERM sorting domain-containing protein n=1 Tax=Croceibacterium xixiisoli TaxID=1476466 RepID=A0A6I4U1Y7_9SPHN|nr:PEP-CTERM sorting domain-containing protein [Croceibacterium xixiisoli]MXP00634.1 PEP-CTERM sorting domain-containing protein [Croceibacterium xixiisoli]
MMRAYDIRLILTLLFGLLLSSACTSDAAEVVDRRTPGVPAVLFVGNSFTQGSYAQIQRYGSAGVTDLNRQDTGGVPGMFKLFTQQAGLDYAVYQETSLGVDLDWHARIKPEVFQQPWDVVVIQEYSLLNARSAMDSKISIQSINSITEALKRANPDVTIHLMVNWARADQIFIPSGLWHGKPPADAFDAMATAFADLKARTPLVDRLIPVGPAWKNAIEQGVARANPYDTARNQAVSLWTSDNVHASPYGHYLQTLVIFGALTGQDPRSLGENEQVARDFSLRPEVTQRMKAVAAETLGLD